MFKNATSNWTVCAQCPVGWHTSASHSSYRKAEFNYHRLPGEDEYLNRTPMDKV